VVGHVSAREDVVFGTVLFGRAEGEGAIQVPGLFINTLPVRIRMGDVSVEEGIRRTHDLLTQLLHHEHAPLTLAQRCSSVPAPLPLFSALLNYRHAPRAEQEPNEDARQRWDGISDLGGVDRSNYPFALSVDDFDEGFALSPQVRAPMDADRVCEYMHVALASIVAALEHAPQTPLCAVEVLSATERAQLQKWHGRAAAYPEDQCIQQLFEEQVAATPQAVALVQGERSLSYAELNAQANRLARHLRSSGVQPNSSVAVYVDRGMELVIGFLAVLKAGGVYVPLDPNYPAERLRYMAQNCAARALLTHDAVSDETRSVLARVLQGPVLDFQSDASLWSEQSPENLDQVDLTPDSIAYVIYTSGSTGEPKGVLVPHRRESYSSHHRDSMLPFGRSSWRCAMVQRSVSAHQG
jgi:non-ribosomal peptide synthetase component F